MNDSWGAQIAHSYNQAKHWAKSKQNDSHFPNSLYTNENKPSAHFYSLNILPINP